MLKSNCLKLYSYTYTDTRARTPTHTHRHTHTFSISTLSVTQSLLSVSSRIPEKHMLPFTHTEIVSEEGKRMRKRERGERERGSGERVNYPVFIPQIYS